MAMANLILFLAGPKSFDQAELLPTRGKLLDRGEGEGRGGKEKRRRASSESVTAAAVLMGMFLQLMLHFWRLEPLPPIYLS